MTKQGNFTQRTPQAKKQSDQASKQVSKQASGSTNAPHDLVFPATGPSLGTTQPTATIIGNQVKRFVWDNIVCRFGLPGEIVSDNGKQFCDNPFKDWCSRLSITQRFASVKHPQTNGLVERANRSLGEGIKARLDRHKGRWVEV
ncbi:reverse transcriptase domain-containing protein [Tanacetum coccineum]